MFKKEISMGNELILDAVIDYVDLRKDTVSINADINPGQDVDVTNRADDGTIDISVTDPVLMTKLAGARPNQRVRVTVELIDG